MRKSLVVGLGGTGGWSLTYLKQRLLADQRWQMLELDPSASTTDDWSRLKYPVTLRELDIDIGKLTDPSAGNTELHEHEILGITAGVGEMLRKYSDPADPSADYPTIQPWLSRDEARGLKLDIALESMTKGAGQIRQFGRLAFFLQVLHSDNGSAALKQLEAAVDLLHQGQEDDERTIYVVGSAAGGTGSGLMLDTLAYLQRLVSKRAGKVALRTIAFVVLPGAFRGVFTSQRGELENCEANGRAFLRELDRMMNNPASVVIDWGAGEVARGNTQPASHVYLVDGSRDSAIGAQLESHAHPRKVLPAAIADAIYMHSLSVPGNHLASLYPNLTPGTINDQVTRYSTFGSYVLSYDWQGITRSFSLRAAREIVRLLRAQAPGGAAEAADAFMKGETAGLLRQNADGVGLPFLLRDVLAGANAVDQLTPALEWLRAPTAEPGADFPEIPDLSTEFPDIGRIKTEYEHEDLRNEVASLVKKFNGAAKAEWSHGMDAQVYPLTNYHHRVARADWERVLISATAAVMSRNSCVGGLAEGLDFLGFISQKLRQYGAALDAIPPFDLAGYEEAVARAKEDMGDSRKWDDASEQRAYLRAYQDLLYQQVADFALSRSKQLIADFQGLVEELSEEIAGWRANLDSVESELAGAFKDSEDLRVLCNEPVLRRSVPLPGDRAEKQLFDESVGEAAEGRLPQRIQQRLDAIHWIRKESRTEGSRLRLSHPLANAEEDGIEIGAERSERDVVISADSFIATVTPIFAGLRGRSVFEVLEMLGESADSLTRELRAGSAGLAALDATMQMKASDGDGSPNWSYVFAGWRSQGKGSGLSNDLQTGLVRSGFKAIPISGMTDGTAFTWPDGQPLPAPCEDKIMLFTARHLMALRAFKGTNVLDQSYRERREASPSPHVMPEEKHAARVEARSERLFQDGLIASALPQLPPDEVAVCADTDLLQWVASCLAGRRLAVRKIVTTGEREWTVAVGGSKQPIGADRDFRSLLIRLSRQAMPVDRQQRQSLRAAAEEIGAQPDAAELLAAFAMDCSDCGLDVGSLGPLLQTMTGCMLDDVRQ